MALLHVQYMSEVLAMKTAMDILLPERPCPRADGRWPTLYLLHGLSDDQTVWQRQTSIERYVEGMDLAVVMPSAHRSFYTDMHHGMRFWTHISEELPLLCERMFPLTTQREDRFAAGLSMGGYGAFKLGLRKPERFAAVASLSGSLDMVSHCSQKDAQGRAPYADAFGPTETFRGSDNDLMAVAGRLVASGAERPLFYMACGTEDFLYENNRGFLAAHGDALGVTYEEGPGAHTWDFWDAYIQRVLAWLPLR